MSKYNANERSYAYQQLQASSQYFTRCGSASAASSLLSNKSCQASVVPESPVKLAANYAVSFLDGLHCANLLQETNGESSQSTSSRHDSVLSRPTSIFVSSEVKPNPGPRLYLALLMLHVWSALANRSNSQGARSRVGLGAQCRPRSCQLLKDCRNFLVWKTSGATKVD